MSAGNNVSTAATLIAEPSRARILDALMTGTPLPAGDLARRAGISASTASGHLARLLDGHLVKCDRVGRERLYTLASPAVADALEALAQITPPIPAVHSLRTADRETALRFARTCYDHLAGHVGVALTDALIKQRLLEPLDATYTVTPTGERRFQKLGVNLDQARSSSRPFARVCTDWSEQRPHLAGALGAALCDALLKQKLILRRPHDRAVTITPKGRAALDQLGVNLR